MQPSHLVRFLRITRLAALFSSSAILGFVFARGETAGERFRPIYHFSPAKNWMNDPNGLVRIGADFHMFYQYNPFGILPAHMSWGHTVSTDLLHWHELPLAIPEQNGAAVFSGGAVLDSANTSGFGKAGKTPLVAIYTLARPGKQNQNIAYSIDGGRTFTAYKGNPVIDLNMAEFRDPMVFWHAPTRKWVMVVSLADLHKVRFYNSPDLKHWTLGGEFGPAGISDVPNWECPNLFELHSNGVSKWILMLGIGAGGHAGGPAGGSATEYFVGSFDGNNFHNDNAPEKTLWLDYGSDFYAAQTWSSMPARDPRRIVVAWMSNWDYGTKVPTKPWRGQMSLPRELSLVHEREGWFLRQTPVREIQAFRSEHFTSSGSLGTINKALSHLKLGSSYEVAIKTASPQPFEMGVDMNYNEGHRTTVGLAARGNTLFVDRSKSGDVGFAPSFAGRHTAPIRVATGRSELRLFVDSCSIEVFAADGKTTITDLVFPPAGTQFLQINASGKTQEITASVDVWKLAVRP